MIVKLLTEHHLEFLSIKRGCRGSSESTLVKMPHYWKSHTSAHLFQDNSRADDWPKVLSLRTLLVRSVQHLVAYTKMFVCMSSFRIRLMTSSLMSTNRVTALEPYIPIITDY